MPKVLNRIIVARRICRGRTGKVFGVQRYVEVRRKRASDRHRGKCCLAESIGEILLGKQRDCGWSKVQQKNHSVGRDQTSTGLAVDGGTEQGQRSRGQTSQYEDN